MGHVPVEKGTIMIDYTKYEDNWTEVKRAARTTVSKNGEGAYPNEKWKKAILLAEHSPIRRIRFSWRWHQLKSWISVHFVRHKIGIEHWVSTRRDDRTGVPRDEVPQCAPVNHEAEADAQALINISRKRLCKGQPHKETREAWAEVKTEVAKADPVLASVMVPECVYRGFCPEFKCCGYVDTEAYQKELAEYRQRG